MSTPSGSGFTGSPRQPSNPGRRPPYETGLIWTKMHKHAFKAPLPEPQFELVYMHTPMRRCNHECGWLARASDD